MQNKIWLLHLILKFINSQSIKTTDNSAEIFGKVTSQKSIDNITNVTIIIGNTNVNINSLPNSTYTQYLSSDSQKSTEDRKTSDNDQSIGSPTDSHSSTTKFSMTSEMTSDSKTEKSSVSETTSSKFPTFDNSKKMSSLSSDLISDVTTKSTITILTNKPTVLVTEIVTNSSLSPYTSSLSSESQKISETTKTSIIDKSIGSSTDSHSSTTKFSMTSEMTSDSKTEKSSVSETVSLRQSFMTSSVSFSIFTSTFSTKPYLVTDVRPSSFNYYSLIIVEIRFPINYTSFPNSSSVGYFIFFNDIFYKLRLTLIVKYLHLLAFDPNSIKNGSTIVNGSVHLASNISKNANTLQEDFNSSFINAFNGSEKLLNMNVIVASDEFQKLTTLESTTKFEDWKIALIVTCSVIFIVAASLIITLIVIHRRTRVKRWNSDFQEFPSLNP